MAVCYLTTCNRKIEDRDLSHTHFSQKVMKQKKRHINLNSNLKNDTNFTKIKVVFKLIKGVHDVPV